MNPIHCVRDITRCTTSSGQNRDISPIFLPTTSTFRSTNRQVRKGNLLSNWNHPRYTRSLSRKGTIRDHYKNKSDRTYPRNRRRKLAKVAVDTYHKLPRLWQTTGPTSRYDSVGTSFHKYGTPTFHPGCNNPTPDWRETVLCSQTLGPSMRWNLNILKDYSD